MLKRETPSEISEGVSLFLHSQPAFSFTILYTHT